VIELFNLSAYAARPETPARAVKPLAGANGPFQIGRHEKAGTIETDRDLQQRRRQSYCYGRREKAQTRACAPHCCC